jgi:hypothetical protein
MSVHPCETNYESVQTRKPGEEGEPRTQPLSRPLAAVRSFPAVRTDPARIAVVSVNDRQRLERDLHHGSRTSWWP